MKINNSDFLQAVWELQLKKLSKSVLNHHPRDERSVVSVSDNSFNHSVSINTCERHLITNLIGKQQAFKRIRDLIASKELTWSYSKITFFIDKPNSKEAFLAAREFWLSNGVRTGFSEERRSLNTSKIDNYDILSNQCYELLKSKFPHA